QSTAGDRASLRTRFTAPKDVNLVLLAEPQIHIVERAARCMAQVWTVEVSDDRRPSDVLDEVGLAVAVRVGLLR
ncbi:hypothetical protein, partial [Frankia sp. Cr1]|uniref:hypothetical protein n=1 Tax=Frankia sp. Cr1 TaxID=3073931 RepID=UPI002AD24298